MADLAKQLRQLQDAQRLRELAQQFGLGQTPNQDSNALRQVLPQTLPEVAGQAMLPPVQMPQHSMPSGQMPPAQMPQVGRQPGTLPPVQMPSISSSQSMTPDQMEMLRRATPGYQAPAPSFKDILFNPGQVMQQNYVDPAVIEQMYYRGLLSR